VRIRSILRHVLGDRTHQSAQVRLAGTPLGIFLALGVEGDGDGDEDCNDEDDDHELDEGEALLVALHECGQPSDHENTPPFWRKLAAPEPPFRSFLYREGA